MVLVGLLAAFLLLPSMASVGMFMDGTIYAAISRNLAVGMGTLWAPRFSEGLFPVFHEHPPLVFWLQSLFFRVLGDSYLTERAYDLVVMLTTTILMTILWRKILAARGLESLAAYWWLPLLLWVVVPKWSWTYRNNMLESTLTVFCLLSILLALDALRSPDRRNTILFAVASAVAALLAFLSKGPVGLFVLAAPVLLAPALPGIGWRRILLVTALLSGGLGITMGLLFAWPEAREMLTFYWQKQVTGRAGVSRLDTGMLVELIKKLVPMLMVLAGLRLWVWRSGTAGAWKAVVEPAAAMLAIGLAASLPLMLGDLDSAHYLVPALPFFALGFGLIGAVMLDNGGRRVRTALTARPGRLFMTAAVVATIGILAMTVGRLDQVRKNEEHHAFLEQVAEVAGEHSVLGIDAVLFDDWYLHAIAQRYYRISLVPGLSGVEWRLAPASYAPADGYRGTGIGNRHWAVHRRGSE